VSDETRTDDTPQDDDAPLVISLVRKEKPFKITREDGQEVQYKLVELDGAERDKWVTEQIKRVKHDEKGVGQGINSADRIQASLLSLAIRDHTNARISADAIQKWPATAINTLFLIAQKMNGLDKESQEQAKKA
jgi:hypothetical protein